jgi:succinoglycan biosynthesis protein ExoV
MIPFYLRNTNNFGDYMNQWLWPKLFGNLIGVNDGIRLIGIGSLIKTELNYIKGKKIIFGTGSGYGSFPSHKSIEEWIIYFVRGPLTAEKLGLDSNKSIVDGAWLISLVPEYSHIPAKHGISFIPHWKTSEMGNWHNICNEAEISYIDPVSDFENIINRIASSDLVITESLHGAILADYYRTPWIPVQISSHFLNFKWHDWCQSVELPFSVARIPPSDFFDLLYQRKLPRFKYQPITIINNPRCEEYREVDVHNKPGIFYDIKGNIKVTLRQLRKKFFNKIQNVRNMPFMQCWNAKHRDCLKKALLDLSHVQPYLSKDSIRQEKIERLMEVRDKLVLDYRNGVFLDRRR